jgi:hypothetical protein
VRKLEQVLRDEGGEGVAVVRPVDLGRAQPVDDDEARLVRPELAQTPEAVQGFEDALQGSVL